jgi:hypothetical protein
LAFVLCGLVSAEAVLAEPYLALRSGVKCNACHVNVTGGGMRTSFVSAHARDVLKYPNWFDDLTKPVESFDGSINDYVAIGADLRANAALLFQDNPQSGRVDNNEVFRGRLDEFDVDVEQAVTYLNATVIPDLLEFYVDLRLAPTTDAREAWGLLYLPRNFFIKGGRMFLPYGLQIQDDQSFIRGGRNGSASAGFNFDLRQAAFELGWVSGPWTVVGAVSEGPGDRDAQVTGSASGIFRDVPLVDSVLAGVSGNRNGGSEETYQFAGFGGFSIGRFSYLGEVDFIERRVVAATNPTGGKDYRGGFIHYSEANYLLLDWLNFKLAFDYADYDGDLSDRADDSENRVSVGFEPFLARFLQTRLFYRVSNGIESNPSHNQSILSAEVHLFF